MDNIFIELYETLKQSTLSCTSNNIALSGGLDSSILTYYLKERKPKATAVITRDFLASDLTYCQLIAKTFGLSLDIKTVQTDELLEAVEETIKILEIFNDIEIRNSVVLYIAFKAIKEKGGNSVITGDGADELFAGYSFFRNKSENELEEELKRIWSIMHFPSVKLGQKLNVKVESPFLDGRIIELAKKIPAKYKVKEENNVRFGKWILRKIFEEKLPKQVVWREKSAMQDGSGTVGLSQLFESIVADNIFEKKKKEIQEADGVIIRTKESMHYYDIYRKFFEVPSKLHSSSSSCPYCQYSVELNGKFCRMCGAFPI
ncbi:MAG: asparagine synthase-related protein [Nitrosopumilaceae archaeon]